MINSLIHGYKILEFYLNNIWNESSARELDPNLDESNKIHECSAIVIGRGSSYLILDYTIKTID